MTDNTTMKDLEKIINTMPINELQKILPFDKLKECVFEFEKEIIERAKELINKEKNTQKEREEIIAITEIISQINDIRC
jgi:hypothetical protein